jgi:hypothetical protein
VTVRPGAGHVAQNEARHLLLLDVVGGPGVRHGARATGVQGVDEHHAGLLLAAHARQQVGNPLFGAQAPILIGVETAVPVGVAEGLAAHLQDRLAAYADDRLAGAVEGARGGAAAQYCECGERRAYQDATAQKNDLHVISPAGRALPVIVRPLRLR